MSRLPLLNLESVSFRYRASSDPVFRDVSMTCMPGSITAIEGMNGAGKSTLLKICAGILAPSAGTVKRTGRAVYQPQGTKTLQPHLTVSEHARLFGIALCLSGSEADDRIQGFLDRLSPPGSIDLSHRVGELSGGTQQKVNLAIALLDNDADLILIDEPYTGFDSRSLAALIDLFEQYRAEQRAVVIVNHLIDPRLNLDQVVELGDGDWDLSE